MKLKKSFLFNFVIALTISSALLFLSERDLFKRMELAGLDVLFRLRGSMLSNNNIVIIEISDEDIAKVGRWPWKRRMHAGLIEALDGLGAKSVFFDVIFSEPSEEEDDNLCSLAAAKAQNVYFPFVFEGRSTKVEAALFPIDKFSSSIKGTGAINVYPDADGTLRRIPLIFLDGDKRYEHIALKLAVDYLGMKIERIMSDHLLLRGEGREIKIPLISKNEMLINWLGGWKETFKHYSYVDILNAYKVKTDGGEPFIDLGSFKNSICIIGVTAIGLHDINPISLEPAYPGIGAVATVVSDILDNNFVDTFADWVRPGLVYLLAILPALLILGEETVLGALFVVFLGVLFFRIDILLFKNGMWLDFTLPLFSLLGSYVGVTTYDFVIATIEKRRFFTMAITDGLTGLFNIRYFKTLLNMELLMAKKGAHHQKDFCIIMSDVDHFKHFNDTYGHEVGDLVLKEVAAVLKNSVRSSDTVARYGGEEMIILLRGTPLKQGMEVAEKIRNNVERKLIKDEKNEYKVTISLGVAYFKPKDDEDIIIKRADDGLYKAKESGRNRVQTVEA